MRNTDHLFHQSERGCDFGCSGQKRNDPAHSSPYACFALAEQAKEHEQEIAERVSGI
jgi:hypothetical protein